MYEESEYLLAPVCKAWLGKIKRAKDAKRAFDDVAEECMKFYSGPHDFMWDAFYKNKPYKNDEMQPPSFRMTVNKAFELVALFGPVLYARNPVRTCTPRPQFQVPKELIVNPGIAQQVQQMGQMLMGGMGQPGAPPAPPPDPMMVAQYQQLAMVNQQQEMQFQQMANQQMVEAATDKARSDLLGMYLNYTPNELGLAEAAQNAITEALIKGMGCLWTETYEPPGSGRRMVGSFYDTVDNLLIDPDAENLDDAKWIARKCTRPYWEVEIERGLPAGSLKKYATISSGDSQGENSAHWDAKDRKARGETNDLIVYHRIFSKMGIGGRLSAEGLSDLKEGLEAFGDYVYIEVCDGCPYFLNLPVVDETMQDEELLQQAAWPIPFWQDDRWPFTPIYFYSKPRSVWPIAPLAPGLGELKFINWSMSFLANRIRTSCRDFIAIAKSAAEEIKQALQHGPDWTMLELEAVQGGIDNVVKFLQAPQVNQDIWGILSAVMEMFDKRVGLTELVYGLSSRQMRSASEAKVKSEGISVRPDYMAGQVEKAMSEAARREAMAIRLIADPADVADIVGPVGAQMWPQLVSASDEKMWREIDVRVEAGSARRPNRERDTDNMNTVMQMAFPLLFQYGVTTGNTNPVNTALQQWGMVMEKDMSGLMMPPVQMAPPPEEGGDEPQEKAA